MFLNKTLALIVSCLAVGLFGPDAVRAGVRLTIDGKTFDDLGEKIATEIREPLRQEISKEGGTAFDVLDLGIIEGTKKPDSAVAYLGTVAGQVQREGKTAGVVTQWFWVKTRVKVDTLGGSFTTKVAAVECQLLLKLTWVPVISRGWPSLVGEAEIAKVYTLICCLKPLVMQPRFLPSAYCLVAWIGIPRLILSWSDAGGHLG